MTTVTLSAGSITMFSSFFSRFSACFSSFVKLLSVMEDVCSIEATLLLLLSLVAADKVAIMTESGLNNGYYSLDIGIRFGVTECFSP